MVPAPFRETIASNFGPKLYVTTAAFDRCIHIYPMEEWQRLQEKIAALPQMDDAVSYFKRRVIAGAHPVELDRQGRILLPVSHREDMGVKGEAVVVGMIQVIEVWDRATWDGVMDPSKVDAAAFKRALSGFGL
jgi:MraZ protein